MVLKLIRKALNRVARLFSSRERATVEEARAEKPPSGILPVPLSITAKNEPELQEMQPSLSSSDAVGPSASVPVPGGRRVSPPLSRWEVTEHTRSPFEKCGRLLIEGDDLVLHSDLDPRGFCIPLDGMADVLSGGTAAVLLLPARETIGEARLSASGRAVNFRVDALLYTSPVARVRDVLDRRARKAAVFVGREVDR